MSAVAYIADTEEITKASWSTFQHDVSAAFKLSDRSSLPPALSKKDLPGGRTQVLNIPWIDSIDHHPATSNEDRATEIISDTEYYLYWTSDCQIQNMNNDDWEADNESDIDLDNGIEAPESPEPQVVRSARNVPGLIRPTWRSMQ